MLRTILITLFCSLFLLGDSRGQDVFVPRQLRKLSVIKPDVEQPAEVQSSQTAPAKESAVTAHGQATKFEPVKVFPTREPASVPPNEKPHSAKTETEKSQVAKEAVASSRPDKASTAKVEPVKGSTTKESEEKVKSPKVQTAKVEAAKAAQKDVASNLQAEKGRLPKAEPDRALATKESAAKSQNEKARLAKTEPAKSEMTKEPSTKARSEKVQPVKAESATTAAKREPVKEPASNLPTEKTRVARLEPTKALDSQVPTANIQLLSGPIETAATKLADGFDFPVGKPDAEGYYRARGYRVGGHMGDDWDGIGGGDTDLKDPIYCIGDGVVVFARDVHMGWGNVVIVRHAYREEGTVKHIDSLYGHLNSIMVRRGQRVARGQQVGTMGTAHGQYDAHLHLEIRKNIEIGMSKSKFQKNLSNYHDPSQFIALHRRISGGGASFRVAMNTFTHDGAFRFDSARDLPVRKRSTLQSAAALRRAVSSTSSSEGD